MTKKIICAEVNYLIFEVIKRLERENPKILELIIGSTDIHKSQIKKIETKPRKYDK